MHIVFVSRELGIYKNTGGIGTYVWDIARRFVDLGHKCTVICSSYHTSMSGDEIIDGVRIIKLPDDQLIYKNKFMYFWKFKKNFIAYRKRIAECLDNLLLDEKIDIIEFAEFGAESIVWQRKQKKVPVVIRWHTPIGKIFKFKNIVYYPFKKWVDSLVMECLLSADLVTFPSKWVAEMVNKDIIPLNKLKFKIIANGINYSQWQIQTPNPSVENKNSANILFVGTLEKRKGFVDLIKAVKLLKKQGFEINLTLVGKQSIYSKRVLQKESEAINEGWLKVIGAVDRGNLKNYYHSADICCFPSWFENMPIVCLEAMACGAIVIGSKNSGMAEIITDGIDGFLVEPKNSEILAECIKKVINLPERYKKAIKEQAKKRIKDNYDNSIIASKMIDAYKETIKRYCKI